MLQEYLAFSEENRTVVMTQVQASPLAVIVLGQ